MAVRPDEEKVETFDVESGKRLANVTVTFSGGDALGAGIGWTKKGAFQVRTFNEELVYLVDLSTGKAWRQAK